MEKLNQYLRELDMGGVAYRVVIDGSGPRPVVYHDPSEIVTKLAGGNLMYHNLHNVKSVLVEVD